MALTYLSLLSSVTCVYCIFHRPTAEGKKEEKKKKKKYKAAKKAEHEDEGEWEKVKGGIPLVMVNTIHHRLLHLLLFAERKYFNLIFTIDIFRDFN